MAASSLEAAQQLMKTAGTSALINQCNKGILVGGLDNRDTFLKRWEVDLIEASITAPEIIGNSSISDFGIPFKSLLKPQQGVEGAGMLYRSGECVLLNLLGQDQPAVLVVERFLSVEIEQKHHSSVQGKVLPLKHDAEGNPFLYGSTGYKIISNNNGTPMQEIISPVTSIARKAIVYPNPCEPQESIVIDFQRKNVPLSEQDIVIPFYSQEGDMVCINGTDPQPWLAKVLNIYVENQTIRVVYYIKAGEKEDEYGMQIEVYKPEENSRLARDRVSWNSVIGLSEGEWNDTTWERPAI